MKITTTSDLAYRLVLRQYQNLAYQAASLNDRLNGDSLIELDATPAQEAALAGLVDDAIVELEGLRAKFRVNA